MIDYSKISQAVDFYSKKGYEYIEVPWLISNASLNITRPKDARPFDTFAGSLVASGEQSFLEIRKNLVLNKKYQCVTPCFRDEIVSEWQKQYFIKNELIISINKGDFKNCLNEVLKDSYTFFNKFGDVEIVRTEIGWDILMSGIELGSYGYREIEDFAWIYGTGCAEPRLSQAIDKKISYHFRNFIFN